MWSSMKAADFAIPWQHACMGKRKSELCCRNSGQKMPHADSFLKHRGNRQQPKICTRVMEHGFARRTAGKNVPGHKTVITSEHCRGRQTAIFANSRGSGTPINSHWPGTLEGRKRSQKLEQNWASQLPFSLLVPITRWSVMAG